MREVTIAGESRRIGEFSAFKAFTGLEIADEVEGEIRALFKRSAEFKREYESENYTDFPRAEARRYFAPGPMYRTVPLEVDGDPVLEDGQVVTISQPLLDEHGAPLIGPDPLGHLTDQDWEASGQKLRVHDSPSPKLVQGAMVPAAFRIAKVQVLRLIALALTSNDELERWEREEKDVNEALDAEAGRLQHKASIGELMEVAYAVVEEAQAQLSGPFDRITAALTAAAERRRKEKPPEPVAPPMTMEEDEAEPEEGDGESAPSTTSSTDSPPPTGGSADTPSTESPSDASPASIGG